tara:strand:- start:39 stop:209 length:171 start_codon:yes stop_codon:yes gene_type:complete
MKGVSHYKKDGKIYKGLMHKANKKLMTGKSHTNSSVDLFHFKELSKTIQKKIKKSK